MTQQPPGPPPEDFPPPRGDYPPPGGGYPPPPPGGGYPPPPAGAYGAPLPPGGVIGVLPQSAYTAWFTRVLAFLIDYIPYVVILGIGWGILMGAQECVDFSDTELGEILGGSYNSVQVCTVSTLGQTAASLSVLVGFAYVLWNYGYRQGATGSSIGKSIMKFKVVSEKTGQPVGFGLSIVRQLAHVIDAIILGIGFLFPLWDPKRQTLADKVMSTVCLPIPK